MILLTKPENAKGGVNVLLEMRRKYAPFNRLRDVVETYGQKPKIRA